MPTNGVLKLYKICFPHNVRHYNVGLSTSLDILNSFLASPDNGRLVTVTEGFQTWGAREKFVGLCFKRGRFCVLTIVV